MSTTIDRAKTTELYENARDEGLSKDEVIIKMYTELGIPLTTANSEYSRIAKEKGESNRVTFRFELYKALREGPVSEEEMVKLYNEFGTPNIKRHWKSFDGIRKLGNEIWKAKN